eukprot:3053271-Rhodomonas_salina.2
MACGTTKEVRTTERTAVLRQERTKDRTSEGGASGWFGGGAATGHQTGDHVEGQHCLPCVDAPEHLRSMQRLHERCESARSVRVDVCFKENKGPKCDGSVGGFETFINVMW